MTWWQTLTITAVPALLTLIITQCFEKSRRRHDAAVRKEEWKAEERSRAHARREAVEDAYRDKRVTAHAEFLQALHDVAHHLDILTNHLETDSTKPTMLELDLMGRYSQTYSVVLVLAGDPARNCAEDADREVTALVKALRLPNIDAATARTLQGAVHRLRATISRYALNARHDGVDPREDWTDDVGND